MSVCCDRCVMGFFFLAQPAGAAVNSLLEESAESRFRFGIQKTFVSVTVIYFFWCKSSETDRSKQPTRDKAPWPWAGFFLTGPARRSFTSVSVCMCARECAQHVCACACTVHRGRDTEWDCWCVRTPSVHLNVWSKEDREVTMCRHQFVHSCACVCVCVSQQAVLLLQCPESVPRGGESKCS